MQNQGGPPLLGRVVSRGIVSESWSSGVKCLESPVLRVRERSKWPIPRLWTITVALFLRKGRMFLMEAIALRTFPVIGCQLSAVKQNGKPSKMGKLQRASETHICETRRVSSLAIFSSSVGNLPPCVSHTHTRLSRE